MKLKATWSLLLLLLVSVQAFAVACDVRCGAMAGTNSTSHMSGMAHCPGMASQSDSDCWAVIVMAPPQSCACQVCNHDWTFVQNLIGHELRASLVPMTLLGHAVMPTRTANSLRIKTDRSPHALPAFDLLISALRV